LSIFPTTILLATDGSAGAKLACQTAVNISDKTSSELHVIYAWLPPRISLYYDLISPSYRFETEGDAHQKAQEILNTQVASINKLGSEASSHLRMVEPDVGGPDAEIVKLAEELRAGLIVLGSRGLGPLRSALMGSVSDSVVRHAHCSVLVVRPEEEQAG
jgi:nucleotide-binding universal stress UspA family protein